MNYLIFPLIYTMPWTVVIKSDRVVSVQAWLADMWEEEYRVPAAGAAAASALWVYHPADFAEWDHGGCGPGDHVGCGPAGLAGWGQAGYARSGLRDVHALGGPAPAATDVPLLTSQTNSLARDPSALTLAAVAPESAYKCPASSHYWFMSSTHRCCAKLSPWFY